MTSSQEPVVPTITAVRLSGAADREEHPLLVLGPAVGTSALEAWAAVAAGLADVFDVLAWDLPGHGYNTPTPPGTPEPTVASLARGLAVVVDDVLAQRGELGRACAFAGVGLGGEVGEHLAAHDPERVLVALRLDGVAPERRAVVLRQEVLGESPDAEESDGSGADGADERARALAALVAALESARSAGLGEREIEVAVAQVLRPGGPPQPQR